jgi:hypothetical protein
MKLSTVDYDRNQPLTTIVVPNEVLPSVRECFEHQLARYAGGYTATPGHGGWLNPDSDRTQHEDVTTYQSAGLFPEDLLLLIRYLLTNSSQIEIYTRRGDISTGYRRATETGLTIL